MIDSASGPRRRAPASRPPIQGREGELDVLMGLLSGAMDGHGSAVFISGEAGIGKTRLAEEFESIATAAGFQVMVGRCVPGAPSPFLPFQEAFSRTSGMAPAAGPSERAVPDPFSAAVDAKGALGRSEQVLISVLDALTAMSARRPVLLRLDDLHWSDTATVQLIHFLARNIEHARIVVVCIYRPEDLERGEGEAVHHLLQSLRVMKREGAVHEISLGPLDAPEVARAVEASLDGTVDEGAMAVITNGSEGNPLFALEMTRWLVHNGSLVPEHGSWKLARAPEGLPSAVREVILRRLDFLGGDQRRMVEWASVIGGDIEPSLLAECMRVSELAVAEQMDLLDTDHRLFRAVDGGYRFTHDKIRQVSYESISRVRRRLLHREVGSLIERRGTSERQYGVLSKHFFVAEDRGRCLRYSLLAGRSSLVHNSFLEASNYYQRALGMIADGDARSAEAWEGLGDAQEGLGGYSDAITSYSMALERRPEGADRARLLCKCSEQWSPQRLGKGRTDKFYDLLEQAEAVPDIGPEERVRVLRSKASVEGYHGDFDRTERLRSEVVRMLEQGGEGRELAWAYAEHGGAFNAMGRPDKARRLIERSLSMFSAHPSPWEEAYARMMLGESLLMLGEADAAEACFNEVLKANLRLGDYYEACYATLYLALLWEMKGDRVKAVELLRRSRDHAAKWDYQALMAMPSSLLAVLYSKADWPEEAERCLAEVRAGLEHCDVSVKSPLYGLSALAEAEVLAAKGLRSEARAGYGSAIEMFKGVQYAPMYEGLAHLWFAELLGSWSDHEHARDELEKALASFEKVGNRTMSAKVRDLLRAIGG